MSTDAPRQTSLEAYNHIKDNGLLSKVRFQVYDYLFNNGPCTAKEVDAGLNTKPFTAAGTYTTRLSELRRQGVVYEVGTVICKETGRNVIYWDVTTLETPLKPRKKRTKVQMLEEEIERLRAILDRHGIAHEETELPF